MSASALILRYRLVQFALVFERIAEIVVRQGVAWLERERPLILRHRLIQFALVFECIAEIIVRLGEVRLECKRPLILRRRLIQIALVLERIAKIVSCVVMLQPGDCSPSRKVVSKKAT